MWAGFAPSGEVSHAFLRHAHSHLGFYAFLFPAVWLAWPGWRPRGWLLAAYGLLAVGTPAAFLLGGYDATSTIGSALVGTTWAVFAWRSGLSLRGDWVRTTGLAVMVALAAVPLVAKYTRTDPVLAERLVRAFLTVLLMGAALPTLVGAGRAPGAPWLLGVGLAAVGAVLELRALQLTGWLVVAALLGWAATRAPRDPLRTTLWLAAAVGLGGYGVGLLPPNRTSSIAGAHFILLGPVALTLLRPRSTVPWLHAALVSVMSGAIALAGHGLDEGGLQRVAAVSGAGVLVTLVVLALQDGRWSDHRET